MIDIYEDELLVVQPIKERKMLESEECTNMFWYIWYSTYRLSHYLEIYHDIYTISKDARTIIEHKMFDMSLLLFDKLNEFLDTCELPEDIEIYISAVINDISTLIYEPDYIKLEITIREFIQMLSEIY